MRYTVAILFRKTLIILFLLAIGLFSLVTACIPSTARKTSEKVQSYTFYLYAWSEDNPENRLLSLDPKTLATHSEGKSMELGQTWRLSPDGSTLVNIEYTKGRNSKNPEDNWIVVYDFQNGTERGRFHPPDNGFISSVSEDGGRILLQPDPNLYSPSHYPPIMEWFVVDTISGDILAHVKDEDNACFRQRLLFDPAGTRIYCVVDPAINKANEPLALQIVAYDVDSETKTDDIVLPEILIGSSRREINDLPVQEFLEPAAELSPVGDRLAIFDANADEIALIDAHKLTVEKTFSLKQPSNLLDWFRPAIAQAKGEMEGMIRQAAFSSTGQHLYLFSQQLQLEMAATPSERGLWVVDLEQERVLAEGLVDYQIQWVRPAPDGTVYAFGTTDKNLHSYEIRANSPSMLWRLDGLTLEILAEREFIGFQQGYIIASPGNSAVEDSPVRSSQETASTNDHHSGCPVTQFPNPAFIPPSPWSAQPPGEDQFWFGGNGLWTALPTSGSWAQLALGEKFWWWSDEFDVTKDETPDLTITASRLDGDSPKFTAFEATNGSLGGFWAMLSGVELSSPGCWEFTGEYKGHQLSFILWVPQK